MCRISAGRRTPSPRQGPYLQKTPPGAGFCVLPSKMLLLIRVGGLFSCMVTTCKSRSTEATVDDAYKAPHFYKYASSPISIGVRSGK